MNPLRFLRPECIRLALRVRPTEPEPDEDESRRERRLRHDKEAVLTELAELLTASGEIRNPTKFLKDMIYRERQATTAIAPGIAIPHVRSLQARSFVMGFARAEPPGVPFASLDGGPTRLFFLLASPPYEDGLYLRLHRQFAEMLQHDWVVEALLEAPTAQDVINVLRGYITA